jgi:hypothetical protein
MDNEDIRFYARVAVSLVIGILVVYPLYLYGRHFLIP